MKAIDLKRDSVLQEIATLILPFLLEGAKVGDGNYIPTVAGLSNVEVINNKETDTQGYMGIWDYEGYKYLIICFQGSASMLDAMTDVKFWKKRVLYDYTNFKIKIHAGFVEAYQSVRTQVVDYFNFIGVVNVICIGHSLGGALATLCAFDILDQLGNVELYTMGCPRVGNQAFARLTDKRLPSSVRFVNSNDIVPSLPPRLFCYEHVGNWWQIGKDRHWWKLLTKGIEDHQLAAYEKVIKDCGK